ncbi:MAG: hypothetical protein PHQ11_04140 [Paludibacter sp.]|nr:hypothetical protein [Paludibacter sp.]MDD4197783.1 hypothetical protein [Paludibacter sp.]
MFLFSRQLTIFNYLCMLQSSKKRHHREEIAIQHRNHATKLMYLLGEYRSVEKIKNGYE